MASSSAKRGYGCGDDRLRGGVYVALCTVNCAGAETEPSGFTTVMLSVPAVARSAAVSDTVNEFALLKVVALVAPLTRAIDDETKFVPLMMTDVAGDPAGSDDGERLVIVAVPGSASVIRYGAETDCAEFFTVTAYWP